MRAAVADPFPKGEAAAYGRVMADGGDEHDDMLLSIGALARATGVPVATLRNWERRYGFPAPARRSSGHRRYPLGIVERLRAVRRAVASGLQASLAISADPRELERLDGAPPPTARIEANRGPAPLQPLLEEWLAAAEQLDGVALAESMQRAWSRVGGERFVLDLGQPFMRAVGERWRDGHLTIMHEHFATEVLSRLLHAQLQSLAAPSTAPPILCAALEGERHGLALELAAVLLTLTGRPVLSLGASTPAAEIAAAAVHVAARAVLVGSSAAASPGPLALELEHLRAILPAEMLLLVGGHPAMTLPPGVVGIASLAGLVAWASPASEALTSSGL